ncbi:MAG: GntR family transcriptional regulator [Saccharospirillaceae bacterium]|nr:GntR family transcriptional regulator [Saccharospirillaceae bacterium]MCD8530247.1 GntR family transcriptional regulator [Saccharospirillaceae bacterium]
MSQSESKDSESQRPLNLAERIYQQLKNDIFDFQLLPGDRFSENEIARRMQASRTPVREALYRLERDGFVQVHFRSGWQVRPFDFRYFEDLYDVRTLLEMAAVKRLCGRTNIKEHMAGLITLWCCHESQRLNDSVLLADMDEEFHFAILELSGNQEMAAIHRMVCERLRIIRRLDFTQQGRIDATYHEHSKIIDLIIHNKPDDAADFLRHHIDISKNTVRHITLHRIQSAKSRYNNNIRTNR